MSKQFDMVFELETQCRRWKAERRHLLDTIKCMKNHILSSVQDPPCWKIVDFRPLKKGDKWIGPRSRYKVVHTATHETRYCELIVEPKKKEY